MKNNINSDINHSRFSYIHQKNQLIDPEKEDLDVAETYPEWCDKGTVIDGRRLTILSKKQIYHVNEKVRIIHVLEVMLAGLDIYLMGPKQIYNEYIDSHIQGEELSLDQADLFTPVEYDGRVVNGPGIDSNFEITVYSFPKSGVYKIYWQPGKWKSNILEIKVLE